MNADFLLVGCVLRVVLPKYNDYLYRFSLYKYQILLISLVIGIIASIYEYLSGIQIILCGNLILFSNTLIFIIVLLFPDSRLGRLLETRSFIFVGKLSYSLYVWQQLFLGSTSYWLKFKAVTFFPFNIIIVFVIAFLSYTYVEKPFLKLKLRFSAL
jgi:peptidoglycan/LPS O-acetylase OafA/YrhL